MKALAAQQLTVPSTRSARGSEHSMTGTCAGTDNPGTTGVVTTRPKVQGGFLSVISNFTGTEAPPVSAQAAGMTGFIVQRAVNLTPRESFRPIMELLLDPSISSPALAYETGDHVAIQPRNCQEHVHALASIQHWDLDANISIEPSPGANATSEPETTLRHWLTAHVDIGAALTPHLLRLVGTHAADAGHKTALLALAEDRHRYTVEVRERLLRLVDVARAFPSVRLPLARFLSAWPQLTPRYYSIASASTHRHVTTRGIVLTFRRHRVIVPAVAASANGVRSPLDESRMFDGVCSSYLASLREGDCVLAAVRPSSFRLPADPGTPVIMLAGGVGIAPFRAFLEDRLLLWEAGTPTSSFGQALLLYGCRDADDEVYMPASVQPDRCVEETSSGAMLSTGPYRIH